MRSSNERMSALTPQLGRNEALKALKPSCSDHVNRTKIGTLLVKLRQPEETVRTRAPIIVETSDIRLGN